jgi:hypothetical protein
MIEIQTAQGTKRIEIKRFSALDGWDLHSNFTRFADSKDHKERSQYVFRVLSHAKVVLSQGVEFPLTTNALIDNHLCTAENVGKVFEAVMRFNGIDVFKSAQLADHRNRIANEIATSFMAQCASALNAFVDFAINQGINHD